MKKPLLFSCTSPTRHPIFGGCSSVWGVSISSLGWGLLWAVKAKLTPEASVRLLPRPVTCHHIYSGPREPLCLAGSTAQLPPCSPGRKRPPACWAPCCGPRSSACRRRSLRRAQLASAVPQHVRRCKLWLLCALSPGPAGPIHFWVAPWFCGSLKIFSKTMNLGGST